MVEWDGSIRAWKEDEHKLKRAVICLVAFCFLLLTECQIIPIQMLLMTFNLFFLHVSPNGRHLKNKQTTTTTNKNKKPNRQTSMKKKKIIMPGKGGNLMLANWWFIMALIFGGLPLMSKMLPHNLSSMPPSSARALIREYNQCFLEVFG